jgi:phospholipid/cholesterol/gamma-HCH transport system substrate-binding protein
MKNSLETRLGIFFALALVAAFLILEVVGGLDMFRRGYRLHALFDSVQELRVADPVKMAGVQIGQVENIALRPEENKVEVVMRLSRDAHVRTDSVATIKLTGLLGQNFVSIDFGTPAGALASAGSYIATTEQPDISSILVKLDNVATGVENLTKTFTGDEIGNLLGPITDFVEQNAPRLTAILGNMQIVSSHIAEGKGTLGKLLYEDTLYLSTVGAITNLQVAADEMKLTLATARTTLENAQSVVEHINSGKGTLGRLAHDEALYLETAEAMANLREVLQKINRGQGSVGQLVNDDTLLKNARMSLQKLDRATEGLEDQGPLSVLGLAIGTLF